MSQSEPTPSEIQGGFFNTLLADASANTLAIGAAAMVPLVAMVGGGIDASRFYMAQSRLQAACDAGALAGRRAMETAEFTQADEGVSDAFFNENYPDGTFGLKNLSHDFSGGNDGEVLGTATGKLPTSLMGMFGYSDFDLTVKCSADINLSNTDIMFVVDVTGSMNCPEDGSSCPGGNNGNVEASNARLKGLRAAVMDFYDTVKRTASVNAQVRYGMVPYASNVNVGGAIVSANPSWMADNAVFQSRWAKYEGTGEYTEIGTEITGVRNRRNEWEVETIEETFTDVGRNRCRNRLQPDDYNDVMVTDLGTHQGQNGQRVEGDFRYTSYTDNNETLERGEAFWDWDRNFGGATRTCTVGWKVYRYIGDVDFEIVEEGDPIEFDEWIYSKIDTASPPSGSNAAGAPAGWEAVNVRDFYGPSKQAQIPIGTDGAMTTLRWDGCIEEAETIATTTWDPVPVGALDMNINLVPSTQDERWKPVVNNIAWERRDSGNNAVTRDVASSERSSQSRPSYSCPKEAFRLKDISRAELQTYVNSLQGRSNTYHDLGMIWGGRFISPNGIFAATNQSAPNGDAISRHVVFMTDGVLEPNREVYGTYGVERWSRRVSGDGESATLRTAHRERLQAACNAVRNENISLWVVAFGTTLTQNLIDCATPGRAYSAANSEQLSAAFKDIAEKIAALRLTS